MLSEKRVFVTVGTTLFDPLIEVTTNPDFLQVLSDLKYTHLTIQFGKGKYDPPKDVFGLKIDAYDYRPSLMSDIQSATLMISHAGAGSIMEGLEQHKKLLVVINPTLMKNHQSELAGALSSRGYLWHLDSPERFSDDNYDIVRKIDALPKENIKMWPKGDEWAFPTFLDAFMGFKDTSKSQ